MASADVLQALPALFSETNQDAESMDCVDANEGVDPVEYSTRLEDALEEQHDLIIDFSSLKSCLDPTGIYDEMQLQQPVSI